MSASNVVRTAIGSILQTCARLGLPVPTFPNSTLNQKLSIQNNISLAANVQPTDCCLVIGNGGHGFILGTNGKPKWKPIRHTTRHTGLYNQLPFVLRLPSNDLTPAERDRYRLRKLITISGTQYVAYYARKIDTSETVPGLWLRHVENGVTTATEYDPSIEDLNPVPPVLTTADPVTTTGDYVASSAKVPFIMSQEEVEEFISACEIIEGEAGFAVISEIGLVSAAERSVTGTFNGASQTYKELIQARITAHITAGFVMEFMTTGIDVVLDVGNVEPLLDLS